MALGDVLAFGKDLLKYRHFEDEAGSGWIRWYAS